VPRPCSGCAANASRSRSLARHGAPIDANCSFRLCCYRGKGRGLIDSRIGIRAARIFDGYHFRNGPVLVLVEDGVISAVDFTGASCPDGVLLVDLGSGALVPGIVDAHSHLCWEPTEEPKQLGVVDREVLVARVHQHAQQALRSGVTAIRDLGDRDYVSLSVRDEYNQGREVGPELVVSGPPLTRTDGHCCFLGGQADTAAQLVDAVRERARRGVDWIKVMATGGFRTSGTNPWRPQYTADQLAAVVDAAHQMGLPVTAHAHATAGIAAAATAGVDGIEHCTFVSDIGCVVDPNVVESIVAQGIWCGITIPRPFPGLPAETLAVLECKWGNVRQLMAAGVRVAFSSDAGATPIKPHDVLPGDLVYLSNQGFSCVEVLAGATAHAAASCGFGDRKGRIAPGYDADLVAVDNDVHNNLEALCYPKAVWRAGAPVVLTTESQPH
jgi:imidazolonepropionase-like amidohydrolase